MTSQTPRKFSHEILKQRLLDNCLPDFNGCWNWQLATSSKGYGQVWDGDRISLAHRISHEVFKGPLGTMFACHKCDNKACINPDHLFAGTHTDNMRDCIDKDRHNKGLKKHQVLEILASNKSSRKLAAEYGVEKTTVVHIRNGYTWSRLTGIHRKQTTSQP